MLMVQKKQRHKSVSRALMSSFFFMFGGLLRFWLVPLSFLFVSFSHAAGIAVDELSIRRMGDAYSGGAAETEDASTVWYNPAAMVHLPRGEVTAGLGVVPHETEFKGEVKRLPPKSGRKRSKKIRQEREVIGVNKNWRAIEAIPSIYMAMPVDEDLWLGAALNSPWGTGTKFNDHWIGRYQSIESNLLTVNLLTMAGWQMNDYVSIGGGLVTEYADGKIVRAVPFPGADGRFEGTGDDVSFGYIAGLHLQPSYDWQFGVNYRSAIKHKLEGKHKRNGMKVKLPTGPGSFLQEQVPAHLKLTIPETVSLSAIHSLERDWQVKFDATWTRWSRFDQLVFTPKYHTTLISEAQVMNMEWHDSWRFALGTEYLLTPKWRVRAGLAYDQSPTPNHTATIDFAVGDYKALSIGGTFDMTPRLSVDLGFQHTLKTERSIHEVVKLESELPPVIRADGKVTNRINSLGASLRWRL